MIIEVEASGTEARYGCVGSFKVPIIRGQKTRFRLLDVTVPDPPLIAPFTAAMQTDTDSFDMPMCRNFLEVCDWLDSLYDSVTEKKLFDASWWMGEFDLRALEKPAAPSGFLQDFLKLPVMMLVNSFYGGTINIPAADISAGYVVTTTFGGVEGFHQNGKTRTKRVGTFPRGANKNSSDYWFETQNDHNTGTISVFSKRRSDGALIELALPAGERWSARIEVEADASSLNPHQRI